MGGGQTGRQTDRQSVDNRVFTLGKYAKKQFSMCKTFFYYLYYIKFTKIRSNLIIIKFSPHTTTLLLFAR